MQPRILWVRIGTILIFLFYSNFIQLIDVSLLVAGFIFEFYYQWHLFEVKRNER